MEEVSELCLNIGDPVSAGVDDLYSCMDNDSADLGGNNSRPPSLMSWTFSPITDDGSYIDNQNFSFVIPDHPSPDGEDQKPEDQQLITEQLKPEPVSQQMEYKTEQQPYSINQYTQSVQQIKSQMNNYSEYIYPNNITYHQSVNIHNYVGNYCTPVWWDQQSCNRIQNSYEKVPTQYVQVIEQAVDPLVGLQRHGTDFTRCSTPDYLMALNSLHQLDSPPRPNHSAAMNFPCSGERNSPQQDSGYNSDLNVSPVIQYQDAIKLRRHTSTPNTYPVLHVANARPTNTATTSQLPTLSVLPTNKPKISICTDNMKPDQIKEQIYQALHNKVARPNTNSDIQQSCHKNPIMSVADYEKAKKMKQKSTTHVTATKRKAESDLKSEDSKKRRHNEPLNQRALEVMTNWYIKNSENPYPTKLEKEQLAKEGGITLAQVKSWFANKRNRSNNTRPKKQKMEMEGRLMEICHQLARDAAKPVKDNAYYIQQLSSILHT